MLCEDVHLESARFSLSCFSFLLNFQTFGPEATRSIQSKYLSEDYGFECVCGALGLIGLSEFFVGRFEFFLSLKNLVILIDWSLRLFHEVNYVYVRDFASF